MSSLPHAGNPVLLVDFEKNVPWCPALQQLLMQKEAPSEKEASQETSLTPSFQLYLCAKLPLEALATGKRATQEQKVHYVLLKLHTKVYLGYL